MLRVGDISEEKLDDIFKICDHAVKLSSCNSEEGVLHKKGMEVSRRWIVDMLEKHGPCAKIAYLDESPVAQILFCPEEAIPFIRDPRKDVVSILCIYSPFPETQRKGIATALLKNLVDECSSGLRCLGGRPCCFLVTLPFPTMGRLSLTRMYEKNGFRQGHKEMFLEVKGGYETRENPDYRTLPGDLGRTIIFYNPVCEWGYFYASGAKKIIKSLDPEHPVKIYNTWERHEEYLKRSMQRVTAGRMIVNRERMPGGIFWTDRKAFRREVKEALVKKGS